MNEGLRNYFSTKQKESSNTTLENVWWDRSNKWIYCEVAESDDGYTVKWFTAKVQVKHYVST